MKTGTADTIVRYPFLALFLLWALPSASVAANTGTAFSWETWNSLEKVLRKEEEPWKVLEPILEAGDSSVAEKFFESLQSPREERVKRRVGYLLKLFEGDYQAASEEISAVPPTDDWTAGQKDYVARLLSSTDGFVENASEHFRVRTIPEDSFLAESALRALEKAYVKMAESFKVVPATMVVVEIYPTVERFSAASTLPEETLERSGAIGICKFRRLMILSPQATPMGYRWLDALTHEYGHLIINQLSGTLCPLWLHEGVARYYEVGWRRTDVFTHSPAEETQLATAALQEGTTVPAETVTETGESASPGTAKSALIPFKRMEPSMVYLNNQEEVSLAFAEVSDAVDYLVDRFGEEKLAELLAAFRRGPREEAFPRVLEISEAELETAWRESLKERDWQLSKGAMSQIIHLKPVAEEEFVGADVRGHIRLGDRLRQQNQFEAALLQYRKALEEEPDNGVALVKLARTHLAREDEKNAEEALRRAVQKNPSYVTPAVLLGELLYEQGRYEEAQPVLYEALEINPFHPRIHEFLGLIAVDLGNFAAARQAIKQALRLDPSNRELQTVLDQMPASPR